MALTAWTGKHRQASTKVVFYALRNTPALIIDCANIADPHRYHGPVNAEAFQKVHVIGLDIIYSYRDLLLQVAGEMEKLGCKRLVITAPHRLFHYQDEEENTNIRMQSWKQLKKLARAYDVHIAIEDRANLAVARIYADNIKGEEDMGHTANSQRQVVDKLQRELSRYKQTLRIQDQEIFDRIVRDPHRHLAAITNASSLHTWAFFILSVCIEQEKRMLGITDETTTLHEMKLEEFT